MDGKIAWAMRFKATSTIRDAMTATIFLMRKR